MMKDASILDQLKDAVIYTVKKQFPICGVFGEDIAEGLKKPVFHVDIDEFSSAQCGVNRYRQNVSFVVSYIPAGEKVTRECADVAVQLIELFNLVKCADGSLYRGSDFSYNVKSGVLEFRFKFKYFAVLKDAGAGTEKMGKLVCN